MLRAAAIFLLTSPPLEELPYDIAELVRSFRDNILSKNEALTLMIERHQQYIEEYIDQNLLINGLK